jgi:hypothetical protein
MTSESTTRDELHQAAAGFVELVRLIPDGGWDSPALGVWTVRDLVGHTSRALSTIETYLAAPVERAVLPHARDYFRAAGAAGPGAADAIAERGRAGGRALGEQPAAAVSELADRVLATMDATADDVVLGIPLGAMRLIDYLPTRIFELIVHSLDLHAALDVAWTAPEAPLRSTARLAADLAVDRGLGGELLQALTGRRSWPDGVSVL